MWGLAQVTPFGAWFFGFFWPYHGAYGILVPQPGIDPAPPAVNARNLSYWTAREIPGPVVLNIQHNFFLEVCV